MIEIELTNREVSTPSLYLMRWKNRTGLVRIIAHPGGGWAILKPSGTEDLMTGLPEDGSIPPDAYLSEPLAVAIRR